MHVLVDLLECVAIKDVSGALVFTVDDLLEHVVHVGDGLLFTFGDLLEHVWNDLLCTKVIFLAIFGR